jgi:rubrerythrin
MVTSERTHSMLETALELEAKGQQFYAGAVATCRNPLGSAMFRKLLDDEGIHAGRIERIFRAVKGGTDWSGELRELETDQSTLARFFGSLAETARQQVKPETTDLEALELGIEFEAAAVRFYESQLAEVDDGLEHRFLQRMVAEERDHLQALIELKRYLADPQAWYAANEPLLADG